MLDVNLNIKIADFGYASRTEGRDGSGYLRTKCGTENHMAPEISFGGSLKYKGTPVDLFACGVILFFMVAGKYPFERAIINDPRYMNIINDDSE